jgi:hypothetical protein
MKGRLLLTSLVSDVDLAIQKNGLITEQALRQGSACGGGTIMLWEIRRKSKPLGVKLTGNGYQSESAAQFAGRRALTELLAGLAKEERRRRS